MKRQERSPTPLRTVSTLVVAAFLSGCGSSPENGAGGGRKALATADGEIVVGVAWPWKARSEVLFSHGLDMALDEVHAHGGVRGRQIRLLKVDDEESVNTGRLVAQRLANSPEVMAVIGHLQSHVTVPAAAIYDLADLLLLSPASTSADLTSQGYSNVFRATFTDAVVGAQMADYAIEQGFSRIAVYYVRSIYGRALANAFEERLADSASVNIVARDSYDPNQDLRGRRLQAMLAAWRNLEIDAIFLAGEVPSAGRLIAAFRKAGLDVPVFGGDAMSSPALIQAGGEATDGIVVATFFHPDEPRDEVAGFVKAFEGRYGLVPDAAAALGYDCLRLLAEAMRAAPTPAPSDVAAALRGLDAWEGVTGPFTFDEQGNLTGRRVAKSVVRNGKFQYLGSSAVGR